MKVCDILQEMPLKAISLHRSDNPGGLEPKELKLVQKYIKTGEYTRQLQGVPFDLYVYILDDAAAAEFGEGYPEGVLSTTIWRDGTETNLKQSNWDDDEGLDMSTTLFKSLFKMIRTIAKDEPRSVHFIMGDNHSDSNKISPTPWMIAHRLGHTFFPRGIPALNKSHELFSKLGMPSNSNTSLESILIAGATMKSVRSDNLVMDELPFELMAQYFIKGKIKIDHDKAFQEALDSFNSTPEDELRMRPIFESTIEEIVDEIEQSIANRLEELVSHGAVVLYI